jgi:oxygen-independent coproporphyrinogen-3 oxidase
MSGIYIHIPFCKQACHYCDFHFSTSLKNRESLVNALCREITLRQEYLEKNEISTIYFGGGTPSLLDRVELKKILDQIDKNFVIANNAEITLEANPDDLTIEKLSELRALGINRLSIGIQSFFNEDLKLMNRAHTGNEATNCVKEAKKAGFKNVSVDLIYGLPGLNEDKWLSNLEKAFELGTEHLSAYNLTVEKRTALAHMVKEKKVALPEERAVIEQFLMLIEKAGNNGFEHYEISNFCRAGMYSRHNSSYWKNESYLGIGPSAHSYNKQSRQWNVANNASYIKDITSNVPWYEQEILSEADKYNEYIMTRLRTIWGIETTYISNMFGKDTLDHLMNLSKPYISSGYIQQDNSTMVLTSRGKLLADKIASDLFI